MHLATFALFAWLIKNNYDDSEKKIQLSCLKINKIMIGYLIGY